MGGGAGSRGLRWSGLTGTSTGRWWKLLRRRRSGQRGHGYEADERAARRNARRNTDRGACCDCLFVAQQQLNDVYKPRTSCRSVPPCTPPRSSTRSPCSPAASLWCTSTSSSCPWDSWWRDRLMLLGTPRSRRYTARSAPSCCTPSPVAVLLHFLIAVYVFGERDLPSYTMDGTESGKWRHHGTKYVEDEQTDIGARLNPYNGRAVHGVHHRLGDAPVLCCILFFLSCTAARRGAGTTTRTWRDAPRPPKPSRRDPCAASCRTPSPRTPITYIGVPQDAPFSRGL